jgi:hypothetical protein
MMLIAYVGTVVFITLLAMGIAALIAKSNGKNPYRWAKFTFFALLVYMVWDIYPTHLALDYYCKKEAGFWVYKTLDQWKAENPGVMEKLVSYNKNPGGFNVDWPFHFEQRSDGRQLIITGHINERFNEISTRQDKLGVLSIVEEDRVLLDIKKNEVIARYVDFGSGSSVRDPKNRNIKFWLQNPSCNGGRERANKFGAFYMQFRGTEK